MFIFLKTACLRPLVDFGSVRFFFAPNDQNLLSIRTKWQYQFNVVELSILPGGRLDLDAYLFVYGPVTNAGTIDVNDSNWIYIYNNGQFTYTNSVSTTRAHMYFTIQY